MPRDRTKLKFIPHRAGQNSKIARLVPLLLDWFARNARDLPWRRTHDPYAIWVSEIMLQQTQVKTVLPYWTRWMRQLPTIGALARARPEKIHKLWEGLGYYTRVRNLQKAARYIQEHHQGRFPRNFADVLALPGIGRYTAGAICSIALNQPTPILDGNVIRVLTRVFGIEKDPKEKKTNALLWNLSEQLVVRASDRDLTASPFAFRTSHLNQSLMELGALVCTPRQPKCPTCPIRKLCVAFREDRVASLPNLAKRVAATERHFAAFTVERQGRFLVQQRPSGVVNAHLWEFPNVEMAARQTLADAARTCGLRPRDPKPFCTIKHSITRYRITLEAFRAGITASSKERAPVRPDGLARLWLNRRQLHPLAFTSAHKKILDCLLAG